MYLKGSNPSRTPELLELLVIQAAVVVVVSAGRRATAAVARAQRPNVAAGAAFSDPIPGEHLLRH